MSDERLELLAYQAHEHSAWLDVVMELRDAGVGAVNVGEPYERLHDAIVRWGEELAQLRLHDPDLGHALNALAERRDKYDGWPER